MNIKNAAKKQASFLTDIHSVMEKHKVKNVLIVYGMNEQIRNTYLFTEEENKLYSFLSDGVNAWMKQGVNN